MDVLVPKNKAAAVQTRCCCCLRLSPLHVFALGLLALDTVILLLLYSNPVVASLQRLQGVRTCRLEQAGGVLPPPFATLVSGFWELPANDRSVHELRTSKNYGNWLRHSLRIGAPAVLFYGGGAERKALSASRTGWPYPTRLVRRPLTDFHAAPLVPVGGWNSTASGYSLRPRALSLVWLEKLAMLSAVAEADPFGTEWYVWVDATLNIYRRRAPPCSSWPGNATALALLPRTACVYAHSDRSPDYIAASVLMVHREAVTGVAAAFYASLAECGTIRNSTECGDDQAVLRLAAAAHPGLFWAANEVPERHKANWAFLFTSLLRR